ncbi:MAG: hypothetical protein ACO3RV_00925 [Luteolibacter sp.]
MNRLLALGIISLLLFSACRREAEVEVTETRPLTTRDQKIKLNATSDERFRNTQPAPVRAETPIGWLQRPGTQFRLLNYRFGESGLGEVWVTVSAGSVLDNVNRWLMQFSATPVSQEELSQQRKIPVAGGEGVWVEASGEYAPGMGASPKPGYSLAGVVAELDGKIITVKMIGPVAEVAKEQATLENFAKSLELNDGSQRKSP